MTTARKSASSESAAKKTSAKKSPAKKALAKKAAAKKSPPRGTTKSANTKTAALRHHITGADTKKTPGEPSAKKDATGKKDSSANACWPGFELTPGKKQGEKGSCKPKRRQPPLPS